ncbi:MAG: tetratricopeptide repeat protein [Ignavibacterium sp.]|nr:MAG: tetratricopeptide repeat protein [Ignavibacterium sp.]
MKSKILFIVLFLLAAISFNYTQSVDALIDEGKKLLHNADVEFDLTSYIKARGMFERAQASDKENYLANYFLAYNDYKLAFYYMQMEDILQFTNHVDSATEILKSLIKENGEDAEAISLLGTVNGIQVSMDPSLGQSNGVQNISLTSEAIGITPSNPRVLLQKGISKYSTPEFFGGSKEKALDFFKRSISIFENEKDTDSKISWGYLDALAWLGKTQTQLGDYEVAISTYNKALQIEPKFSWVKNILLPAVQEKLTSQ